MKFIIFMSLCLSPIVSFADQTTESLQKQKSDFQRQFEIKTCSVLAETRAQGILFERNLTAHGVIAQTVQFSEGIYGVLVTTEIVQDFLILQGPDIGFSCYRCPNFKLVISQDSKQNACSEEQL